MSALPYEVPWPSDWSVTVVRQLASGLMEYADLCGRGGPLRLPYPANLQRALDRLTVMCLAREARPPASVVDLLRWCSRPVSSWPVVDDIVGVDDGEQLLSFGYPSGPCQELGKLRGDVEGELRENVLIDELLDVCKEAKQPDTYVAFRALLIEQPAMSELELQEHQARPELAKAAELLRRAYPPAPPEALVDGIAEVCGGCGNLRVPGEANWGRVCVDAQCPDPGAASTTLPADAGVVWIHRELRTFIAAPGRAELRIRDKLRKAQIPVREWPDFDACDLAVFDKEIWAVDVKSWASPARLATRLNTRPFLVPRDADRGFIVVANEQCRARKNYIRLLQRDCPAIRPGGAVTAMSERDFIAEVLRRHKGAR